MTSRDFCYWLQGYFEIAESTAMPNTVMKPQLNEFQTGLIRNHLAMVFRHEIDPSFGPPKTVEDLRKIHEGFKFDNPIEAKFNC